MKKLLIRIVFYFLRWILKTEEAKLKYQPFFEELNSFSLESMNYGTSDPNLNGEYNLLDIINKKITEQDSVIIFDVGAHIGNYTNELINHINNSNLSIYCFEPSKETFMTLKKNINNKNVIIFNLGFGDENTTETLFYNSETSSFASLYERRLNHFNIELNSCEEVTIMKIDDFCKENNINRIDFLKLDVEGNEVKILEGASKMIENSCIESIQFEFGGCNIDSRTYFQDFYYLLKSKYNIYRIVKDGLFLIESYNEKSEILINSNFYAELK